jgi:hypothetical protein
VRPVKLAKLGETARRSESCDGAVTARLAAVVEAAGAQCTVAVADEAARAEEALARAVGWAIKPAVGW